MKIILILLFLLTSPVFSQNLSDSQSIIQTYKNSAGIWNTKSETFDFNDFIYADIKFIFDRGKSIIAFDQVESIYKIITTSSRSRTYNCIDNKNRECVISIVSNDNESYIVILYDKIAYIYYIKIP